jgi:adenylate kinase
LVQREDDKEETVKKRLDVYSQQTRPLVAYYSDWAKSEPQTAPQYRAISGMGSVEEITQRALQAFGSKS